MTIDEICIRDPFIMPDENVYYLYGSRSGKGCKQDSLDVYTSADLINWSKPKTILNAVGELEGVEAFWAPEVYKYNGKFYMFATIKKKYERRGTCVFVSDSPDEEFKLHSNGPVTPGNWECLDGTLWVENGKNYMVFCHEWVQSIDGTICRIELTDDLKAPIGETKILFHASEAKHIDAYKDDNYVTDAPFIFKEDGTLFMTWSSFMDKKYVISVAYSETGKLDGEWKHCSKAIFDSDGGHGMIFKDFSGQRKMCLHSPNSTINPSPKIFDFLKRGEKDYILRSKSR